MDYMILKMRQGMTLKDKIRFSEKRIHQWVDHFGEDKCYISFSGGKDSTVLLHLVRNLYPNIEAVFCDTGLEYPEVRKFVKKFDNVTIIRPKMRFDEVIKKYGFPVISKEVSEAVFNARIHIEDGKKYKAHYDKLMGKLLTKDGKPSPYNLKQWAFLLNAPFKIGNRCCSVMKKTPVHLYHRQTGKVPFSGVMAEESRLRTQQYLKQGCNGFENKIPTSTPLAFWREQDVLQYLYENKLDIAEAYGTIQHDKDGYFTTKCNRTGCMFCGFGCHLEDHPNRFEMLATTHPKQYDYIINTLGMGEVLDWLGIAY